jgi:hypothetical protein
MSSDTPDTSNEVPPDTSDGPILPPDTSNEVPPPIATLEELLASQEAAVHKEADDRSLLTPLRTDPRGALRVPLFQWAAANFPNSYVLLTFDLTPPAVCSDGVIRNAYDYTEWCLGCSMADLISTLQSRITGMVLSYSFANGALRIHVTR